MRSGAQDRSESNPIYQILLKYCKHPKFEIGPKSGLRVFVIIFRALFAIFHKWVWNVNAGPSPRPPRNLAETVGRYVRSTVCAPQSNQ